MKKLFFTCLMAISSVLTLSAQEIYRFTVKDDIGRDVPLAKYTGQVLLIVNTATRCGFTPQYKELEQIYEKFRAQGFVVLDFPCNQFGAQAPGSIEEIHQFCTANFAIEFPQFDKVDVNGENESPLFAYLKSQQGFAGFDTSEQRGKFMDNMLRKKDPDYATKPDIKWNFTKFVIDKNGDIAGRFEPTAAKEKWIAAIEKALA